MLIPLYGFVPGDTLGVLVLAQSDDTIQDLANSLAQAVSVRVAVRGSLAIRWGGVELDPTTTLDGAGIRALQRIDLVVAGGTQ
jgi:hypothetical protein